MKLTKIGPRAVTSSWVLALALTLIFALNAAATMKMTPYLQAVKTDSIYVLVECDTTAAVTVQYGLTNAYGSSATTESTKPTTASPVTYMHRVKLTGLDANTQYHYRATQGGVTYSADSTFYTACLPGTPYRFAYYADTRTQPTVHNTIAGRVKNANPRFALMGGDTCNDSAYATFKSEWFVSNELLLQAAAPVYIAPGNHEGYSTNVQAFFQSPASGSGIQDYYSFDYGDVHFVSINNQVNYAVASPQYNFVRDDLAASTKPWKIVMFHYSDYVSGGHGEDATMISWSQNLFVPNGVDLVLTGHSHFYQHNLVSGINHVVAGTAGAPFATYSTASYTLLSAYKYHYAIVDVTPTTLHMEVRDDSGTGTGALIDTLDLVKTVAAAKTKVDGTLVDIMGTSVVTLVPNEAKVFYAQDLDGVSGIRVETNGTRPAVGATVLLRGTLGTKTNGERVLLTTTVTTKSTGTGKARALTNESVGGVGYVGSEDRGLVNQGLLMTVYGQVTKVVNGGTSGAILWLDDGSGVDSGEVDGTKGVKVIESGLSPAVGTFLTIHGVVASEKAGAKTIRVIRYKKTLPS